VYLFKGCSPFLILFRESHLEKGTFPYPIPAITRQKRQKGTEMSLNEFL
jgi:hypothetical protein